MYIGEEIRRLIIVPEPITMPSEPAPVESPATVPAAPVEVPALVPA